jgi:hypothetical protein
MYIVHTWPDTSNLIKRYLVQSCCLLETDPFVLQTHPTLTMNIGPNDRKVITTD